MSYADTNDRDIRAKQKGTPEDSEAFSATNPEGSVPDQGDDTAPDPGDVNVLPGTGGPDDVGDVEVDPDDLNMSGH
jgi:hypothetical protein